MTPDKPYKITVLGNHPPRQCGIATFTADLADALATARPGAEVCVVAMNDGHSYAYPPRVALTVEQNELADYLRVADELNARHTDVLCVQHEFGIFGGPAGSYLLSLLRRVRAPIITTLHTVLEQYTPEQQAVIEELTALSARLVVMSARAVGFLVAQGVPREKIAFIHHGIPDISADRETAKARLGLTGRTVVLTFGLLSSNKGLDTAIRALPEVVATHPQVTYLILGATHPHIREREGEAYREGLVTLTRDLDVASHVRFDDKFCDLEELTVYLAAADIYLTPYLNREQITSGTLAYALGSGRAVISTPYWHAEELLAEERGVLVPFRDPAALAGALCGLLDDPARRRTMEKRARAYGEQMRWPSVGAAYADLFDEARRALALPPQPLALPPLSLTHVAALTDSTGLLQHATVSVPNPHEGYTTDDNARALHLMTLAQRERRAPDLTRRYLAFLHFALDPLSGKFHNFMGYDRRWLDAVGGENAQARAVRALVAAAHRLEDVGLRGTAQEVLARAWGALDDLQSPRAQALALIALADQAEHAALDDARLALAHRYAQNLRRLNREVATSLWPWFETYLSYSNAKLPHSLIAYGRVLNDPAAQQLGLETLRWLEEQQTGPGDAFLPVGSERLYHSGEARPLWDGQPVEAYAAVSADLEAYRATGDAGWLALAQRATEWLLGRNALGVPLHDAATGGSRDGLHRDRANTNEGAESTLALWLSVAELTEVTQLAGPRRMIGD
ncbi:Glycosyltransferase subfamily 4-like N-terminal domain-containing protein [Deinococcus saxicola]|uniref:glycosyltransferase family 4 protein n=1 Tax=Deinococcus saxicola TaxID=249406 RepID=UPI0039EE38D9